MYLKDLKTAFASLVIVIALRAKNAIPPPRPVTQGTCQTMKSLSEFKMLAIEVLESEQSQVSVTANMSK